MATKHLFMPCGETLALENSVFTKHCKQTASTPHNLRGVLLRGHLSPLQGCLLGESRWRVTFRVDDHGRNDPFVGLDPLQGFVHFSLRAERTPQRSRGPPTPRPPARPVPLRAAGGAITMAGPLLGSGGSDGGAGPGPGTGLGTRGEAPGPGPRLCGAGSRAGDGAAQAALRCSPFGSLFWH